MLLLHLLKYLDYAYTWCMVYVLIAISLHQTLTVHCISSTVCTTHNTQILEHNGPSMEDVDISDYIFIFNVITKYHNWGKVTSSPLKKNKINKIKPMSICVWSRLPDLSSEHKWGLLRGGHLQIFCMGGSNMQWKQWTQSYLRICKN